MFSTLIQHHEASIPREEIHGPSLVLTADPKPRLRWTVDLHDRFIDAVTQLGGPEKATPKSLMRQMGVKGLTLFHLKSHLQKYRMGKQSSKEMAEQSKDTSYQLETPSSSVSPRAPITDVNEGHAVKEALRAQMEVQRRLHEQVEVQKHVQIRVDAFQKYIDSLLERACRIATEHIAVTGAKTAGHDLPDLITRASMCSPSDPLSLFAFDQSGASIRVQSPEGTLPSLQLQKACFSTGSCPY